MHIQQMDTSQVLCLADMKMSLFARSCVCPGSMALITNILSSFEAPKSMQRKPVLMRKSSSETERSALLVHPHQPASCVCRFQRDFILPSDLWTDEYVWGGMHEIVHYVFPKQLWGVPFAEAAYGIYRKLGIMLFALRRKGDETAESLVPCESTYEVMRQSNLCKNH